LQCILVIQMWQALHWKIRGATNELKNTLWVLMSKISSSLCPFHIKKGMLFISGQFL
jgi:hypothetical protein